MKIVCYFLCKLEIRNNISTEFIKQNMFRNNCDNCELALATTIALEAIRLFA